MKIVFIASEVTPIVKVGGLADVVGALPGSLASLGHQVALLVPNYGTIDHVKYPAESYGRPWSISWEGRQVVIQLWRGFLPDTTTEVFYLDCPEMFQGRGPNSLTGVYANSNDSSLLAQEMKRFVFFSIAAAGAITKLPWAPDVVHGHDWHAALSIVALQITKPTADIPTLLTIHNLQSQGRWNAAEVFSWLGWSGQEHPILTKRDGQGNINMLQLGIAAATAVNTVSPNYAREILQPEYGEGLVHDLRARPDGVTGILNGIDTMLFNPATDKFIAKKFETASWELDKNENKVALKKELGLQAGDQPLFISIGRFSPQKGYDLVQQSIEHMVKSGGQVAMLGSGVPDLEQSLQMTANQYPGTVVVHLGFDAALAQRLYAAGDFFLMPSRFEPCGLGQMIAMRYGTIPIVRDTGGLHDSVVDIDTQPNTGTGIVFSDFSSSAFNSAVDRALQLFQKPDIVQVRQRDLDQDFSWTSSAHQYDQLYAKITK